MVVYLFIVLFPIIILLAASIKMALKKKNETILKFKSLEKSVEADAKVKAELKAELKAEAEAKTEEKSDAPKEKETEAIIAKVK
jgi:membrane protein involved in colicin uptake